MYCFVCVSVAKLQLNGDAVFRCVVSQLVSSVTSVVLTSFLYIFLDHGYFKTYAYGYAMPHLVGEELYM